MKWVFGNTLTLSVPLKLKTVSEGTTTETDYTPPSGSEVSVNVQSRYKKIAYSCSVSENVVTFTDDATLAVGKYSIEICVVEPSRKLCTFDCGILEIVQSVDELELGEFIADNNVVLDAAYFIQGPNGKSAYEVAVDNGFEGTEAEWLASLKGEPGTTDYEELENKPDLSIYLETMTEERFNEIFD